MVVVVVVVVVVDVVNGDVESAHQEWVWCGGLNLLWGTKDQKSYRRRGPATPGEEVVEPGAKGDAALAPRLEEVVPGALEPAVLHGL